MSEVLGWICVYLLIGAMISYVAFRKVNLTHPIAAHIAYSILWPLAFVPVPRYVMKSIREMK